LNSVERGDVFHVDLNPIQGREQAGARYGVIVSPKAFNVLGTPLVCPITQGGNFARHAGFAVSLSGAGTETQGVVLCNQPRVLDLQARKARFIERVPDFIMDEVLAKLLPPVQ
jgi:mRNA-degrading endonuclease toxin of MazEF toxin-antitoxin module